MDDGDTGDVRAGIVAMLPFVVGYAPFALVIGAALASNDQPLAGWLGIWPIFGGSAHLVTIRTVEPSGVLLAVVTGLLVNARVLVYSASLAPRWRHQPRWFRMVGAALLIDATWQSAVQRPPASGVRAHRSERRFHLAAGVTLGAGWCTTITIGMLVGGAFGTGWGLEATVPLCLLAMVGPRVLDGSSRWTIAVAAAAALLAPGLPPGVGVIVAVAAGAAAGVVAERHRPASRLAEVGS